RLERLIRSHGSTVPSGHAEPCSAVALELSHRCRCLFAMVEEPVDRRTGPGDVGPEGTESPQLAGERRRGEVVEGKAGEGAGPAGAPGARRPRGSSGTRPACSVAAGRPATVAPRARRGSAVAAS